MTLEDTLKRIRRARRLNPPVKMPRPNKRVKLGKGYDIMHRVAMCEVPDKRFSRFFVRYKREPICMSRDWDLLMQHMGWDF